MPLVRHRFNEHRKRSDGRWRLPRDVQTRSRTETRDQQRTDKTLDAAADDSVLPGQVGDHPGTTAHNHSHMLKTIAITVERHLFSTVLTLVLLFICAGLSWWIWLDRSNRFVPGADDLVELRGVAHSPQFRNRSSSVWFRFDGDVGEVDGHPAPSELKVTVRDAAAIEEALKDRRVRVVAWVVRAELGRGAKEEPPGVLQLLAGNRMLVPLASGQALRAEQAGNARLGVWMATAGIVGSLVAMVVHWVARLRA